MAEMNGFITEIMILANLHLPSETALHDFPDWSTCTEQREACKEILPRLKTLRHVHGWGQCGYYQVQIDIVEEAAAYYKQLQFCHESFGRPGTLPCRRALDGLKILIGPERFLQRWHPDKVYSLPVVMTPAESAANANGANR
jgi:hypothetical protein